MAGKKGLLCLLLSAVLAMEGITITAADNNIPLLHTSDKVTALSGSISKTNTFENDNYIMNLDEATLGISLKDKKTGYVYESVVEDENSNQSWKGFLSSGISVELCTSKAAMPERVDLIKGNAKKTFTYYKNGFDAVIEFPSYDFQIGLEVRLKEDGFSASVKQDSITEGEDYKLSAVYLYPLFGATKGAEKEGYILIPEGAGALINLTDNQGKYKTPYAKKIYGSNAGIEAFGESHYDEPAVVDPEKITAPVFGMIYTKSKQGFLGIAEDGQYNGEILAYPNGVMTDYNWVTARFNYREIYTMQTAAASGVPTFEKKPYMRDISISYKMVNGDQADYTGLAKVYQQYLLQKGDLQKQEDKFQIKVDFFGADTKKWFIFNQVVPMTTVKDMKEIIDNMVQSGVKDLMPVYTGWQQKGASLNYGSGKFKVERKLGSQSELYDLAKELKQKDISLVLKQDFLLANPKRFYNTAKDIVKGINQVLVEKPTNAYVFPTMYYMTPSKTLSLVNKWKDRYDDTAISSIALSSLPNTLFSYYSGGKIYTRGDTAGMYEEALKGLQDYNVSLENPNEYLWKYTGKFYDMPLSTSNYSYISKEVPFLPIVLRGYLPYWAGYSNFVANETEYFLKMLEYGAYPNFLLTKESPNKLRNTNSSYIYTSEYEVLKPTIENYYNSIGSVLRQVEGSGIKSHTYLNDKVVSVLYDNGVNIIINYSDSDFKNGEIMVGAMSYQVIGSNAGKR